MVQNVRFGENLNDRKCSKCKKTKEPQDFELRNLVYRTCNHCRFKAYQRMHPLNNIADFNRGGNRVVNIDSDSEQSVSVLDRVRDYEEAYLMMSFSTSSSSSSAAAAASSESYFGPEPEPEPEPDM